MILNSPNFSAIPMAEGTQFPYRLRRSQCLLPFACRVTRSRPRRGKLQETHRTATDKKFNKSRILFPPDCFR